MEAEANLEAVEAEKKRLLAQWRASLAALRQRDETLQVGSAALTRDECGALPCALTPRPWSVFYMATMLTLVAFSRPTYAEYFPSDAQ